MRTLVLTGAVGALLLAAPHAPAAPDAPKATRGVGQLRAELEAARRRLQSVSVSYRFAEEADHADAAPGAYWHRTLAVQAPSSFFLDMAHGADRLDWRDNPGRTRSFALRGRYLVDWPADRGYEERPLPAGEALPTRIGFDHFLVATGWWPSGCPWPAPRVSAEQPFSLHEVAASPAYRLLDRQEQAGGRWCHVLERPNRDRLWIDADRGCALLARELRDAATGALAQTFTLGGHEEAAPGVWLPGWFEVTYYDFHAPTPAGRRRVVNHFRATILERRANQVPAGQFQYEPPPGALRMNRAEVEWKQVRPGGLDYLDLQARHAREAAGARGAGRHGPSVGWFAALPALAVLGVCEVWLRRRRRNRPLPGGCG